MFVFNKSKLNNVLFKNQNGFLTQLSSPEVNYDFTKEGLRELLKKQNIFGARWWSDFDNCNEKKWWHVVKKKTSGISEYSKKTRNQIRRGIKHYFIKEIEKKDYSETLYEIYLKVFNEYNTHEQPDSKNEFMTFLRNSDETHQIWGVYDRENGSLVGFAECVIDMNFCLLNSFWILKDSQKNYAAYALIYELIQYYLVEHNFNYFSDGCRQISHDTNVHNFFMDKFNFEKSYCSLNVLYKNKLTKNILSALIIFSPLIEIIKTDFFRKLKVLITLEKYNSFK